MVQFISITSQWQLHSTYWHFLPGDWDGRCALWSLFLAFFFHLLCNVPLSCWPGNQAMRRTWPWWRWGRTFRTACTLATSLGWRNSQSTSLRCCVSQRLETAHGVLRTESAPMKTVSVRALDWIPSWVVFLCCWTKCSKCVSSPRACGSPELHRDPGHVPQSELERATWEERHSHRCHYAHAHTHTRHCIQAWIKILNIQLSYTLSFTLQVYTIILWEW